MKADVRRVLKQLEKEVAAKFIAWQGTADNPMVGEDYQSLNPAVQVMLALADTSPLDNDNKLLIGNLKDSTRAMATLHGLVNGYKAIGYAYYALADLNNPNHSNDIVREFAGRHAHELAVLLKDPAITHWLSYRDMAGERNI